MIVIGACALGAITGYFLGTLIYNLGFYWAKSLTGYICLTWGLALVFIGLAIKFYEYILIFGTSLVGSYTTVRAIAMFGGGYPNEAMLYKQLAQEQVPELDNLFYMYIGFMAILFVGGMYKQIRSKNVEDEEEDYHKA